MRELPTQYRHVIRTLWPLGALTLLCLAGAVCCEWLVLEPATEQLAQAEAHYDQAKEARAILARQHNLQERIRTAEEELSALWKTLPGYDDLTAFSVGIAQLAAENHLHIPGMNTTIKPETHDEFVEATLSFSVSGSYAAIYRFIAKLEASEDYVVIEKLDARRVQRSAEDAVTVTMTLATFVRVKDPLPRHI